MRKMCHGKVVSKLTQEELWNLPIGISRLSVTRRPTFDHETGSRLTPRKIREYRRNKIQLQTIIYLKSHTQRNWSTRKLTENNDFDILNPFTGQDENTRPAVAAFPMGRTRYLVRTGVVASDLGKPSYPVQENVLLLITIL